jgi:site-specific recombinase XerD
MAGHSAMTDLRSHLDDYLRLRRALGFKLVEPGRILPHFLAYLESAGAATITIEHAVSWAKLPSGVQPIHWAHRLSAVRGFATYLNAIDPTAEVPPRDLFAARQQRPTPYLWSEEEICRLMTATRSIRPELRALSHEALFGLVWASGLRIGEAISLDREDVDLAEGVITVRATKAGRSRFVPLHFGTTDALCTYAASRDVLCHKAKTPAFFVSGAGTRLLIGGVQSTFRKTTSAIGLRTDAKRPRIHDIRHSFAVRVLIECYRSGSDVESMMPWLSAYLGHLNAVSTYWYLSAAPELMELVAARFRSATYHS